MFVFSLFTAATISPSPSPSPVMSLTRNYGAVTALPPDGDGDDAGNQLHSMDTTSLSRRSRSYGSRSPMARRRGVIPEYDEQDPFLPIPSRSNSPSSPPVLDTPQPRRKISTLWLVPVVLMEGIARGMTMAPRIELYTQIACDEFHPPLPPSNLTTLLSFPTKLDDMTISPSTFDTPVSFDSSHTSSLVHTTTTRNHEVRVAAPSKECLHDPEVQSRAAGIQATLGTIVGVLSIMTSGYWGQLSDAFGRKSTLSVVLFGMTVHDVIYILVSIPHSIFNRFAWGFMMVGSISEGLLGSLTTMHAAQNAFLSDCATSGSRSTIFAYFQGLSYVALATGPQIAGIFLNPARTDVRTVMFYSGLAFNFAVFCYALLILPETVTPEMMHIARHPVIDANSESPRGDLKTRGAKWAQRMKLLRHRVLAPLTIFGPKRKPGGGWDFNMTLLVIAQFTHLMSVGVVDVKFLYAQHTYTWTVKQLSYYISLLWYLRAFHLLLLLPTIVHFIKPKRPHVGTLAGRAQALSQDMKFDYRIAQFSIFIDTMAYVLTLIAPAASQVLFICFTSLSSFTAGVNPAIHSLAVSYLFAFNDNANIGQMFGAISMLQAMSRTLQPLVFGVLYSETVATFPKAIFALAAGLLISSSAMFTLLRTDVASHMHADTEVLVQQEPGEPFERDADHESMRKGGVNEPLLADERESGPSSTSR